MGHLTDLTHMWNGFSQVILQLQLRGGDDHNHHSCRLWKVFWSLLANFWAESRSQSVIDVNGPQLPHTWKIILEEEGEAQQTKSPPPHTYQDKTPRALKSSKIQLTNNQAIEKSLQAWKSTRNLDITQKVIFPIFSPLIKNILLPFFIFPITRCIISSYSIDHIL